MLHPSGYCVYYHDASSKNLKPGEPCLFCGMVAGHKSYCSLYVEKKNENNHSRVKLFDRCAVLWHRATKCNFFTFTLPPTPGKKTYQVTADCAVTGDLAVTAKFSKLMENCAVNIKRTQGEKFSYVWVSEAQMQRAEKFGGIGDLHFHMLTDAYIPIKWLNNSWAALLNVQSKNCVHLDEIPNTVNTLPNYLAKYMGKGAQRAILSRRFGSTRDLSGYAPIRLDRLPAGITEEKQCHFTTPQGYEVSMYYFNTAEILSTYATEMEIAAACNVKRTDKNFTEQEIDWRKQKRDHKQKSVLINSELQPLFR